MVGYPCLTPSVSTSGSVGGRPYIPDPFLFSRLSTEGKESSSSMMGLKFTDLLGAEPERICHSGDSFVGTDGVEVELSTSQSWDFGNR